MFSWEVLDRAESAIRQSNQRLASSQRSIRQTLDDLSRCRAQIDQCYRLLERLAANEDAELIAAAASDHVQRMGLHAVAYFRDFEDFAVGLRDVGAAQAWGELSDMAADILSGSKRERWP